MYGCIERIPIRRTFIHAVTAQHYDTFEFYGAGVHCSLRRKERMITVLLSFWKQLETG